MSPFPLSHVNKVQIPLCVWSRKFYDVIIIRLFYLKKTKNKKQKVQISFRNVCEMRIGQHLDLHHTHSTAHMTKDRSKLKNSVS